MRTKGRERTLVKSAVRVVEILELFSRERRPLTLSEIIEALGYPQSSTTVMLKSLLAIGYLNYNIHTRTYLPNIAVAKLGDWIEEADIVNGPIQDLMRDLNARTTESVSVGVQNDINIHFLTVLNSEHKIKFFIPPSGQRTLLQSNLGWMLLSTHTDKEIAVIYERIRQSAAHRMVEFDMLMTTMREVRQKGYCFVPDLPVAGAASVAMLLPTRFHGQPMAIGIGGYVPRLAANLDRIVKEIRTAMADYERETATRCRNEPASKAVNGGVAQGAREEPHGGQEQGTAGRSPS